MYMDLKTTKPSRKHIHFGIFICCAFTICVCKDLLPREAKGKKGTPLLILLGWGMKRVFSPAPPPPRAPQCPKLAGVTYENFFAVFFVNKSRFSGQKNPGVSTKKC